MGITSNVKMDVEYEQEAYCSRADGWSFGSYENAVNDRGMFSGGVIYHFTTTDIVQCPCKYFVQGKH